MFAALPPQPTPFGVPRKFLPRLATMRLSRLAAQDLVI